MVLGVIRRRVWNYFTVSRSSLAVSRQEKCLSHHCEASKKLSPARATLRTPPWKILFFGTDEFALHSFKILNEQYKLQRLIERLEVVTAYKGKENAVIRYANENGIIVHSWPPTIPLHEFDVGLVVSFGHMIPVNMIESFPMGMLNVHASLLPKLRGAAPIIHALMRGDDYTGVTIMKIMPDKFDVGEILAQEGTIIHPDETMPELYVKLAKLGADLLMKTMNKLPSILTQGQKQCDAEASYARKITSKSSIIRWNEMSAKNVYDMQRALTGIHTPYTKFEDQTIKLLGIRVFQGSLENLRDEKPGCALYDKKQNVLLAKCKDESWISIDQVIIPGHRPMSARDFKNGFISKRKRSSIMFQ